MGISWCPVIHTNNDTELLKNWLKTPRVKTPLDIGTLRYFIVMYFSREGLFTRTIKVAFFKQFKMSSTNS